MRVVPIYHAAARISRRAFSLVEVLLAIFILGIGMIMVASVFPVGANWTRETTEDSVCQVVGQTAVSVIKTHYGPNGDLRSLLAPIFFDSTLPANNAAFTPVGGNTILQSNYTWGTYHITPFVLQAPPGFNNISLNERAYQFISSKSSSLLNASQNPFPASNPSQCVYFWTALMRLNTAHLTPNASGVNNIQLAPSYKYDLYIMVFRKGWADQFFTPIVVTPTFAEVKNTRPIPGGIPAVGYDIYYPGDFSPGTTPSVTGAVPPMGQYGIGAFSGTVFRQIFDINAVAGLKSGGIARPGLLGQPTNAQPQEPIIYAPPSDDAGPNGTSPLVYIYQTTLSF